MEDIGGWFFYRVEDTHCIFIDSKATETFKRAAEAIVRCYKDIFLKVINSYKYILFGEMTPKNK